MSSKTCISQESFVLTKNGYINLKTLVESKGFDINNLEASSEINTKICNKEGKLCLAKYLNNNGKKKLFRITSKTGIRIDATNEQNFYVLNENGFIISKKLKDLKVGDILLSRVGDKFANDKQLITPDEAYLLGIFYSLITLENPEEDYIKIKVSYTIKDKIKEILLNKFDVVEENEEISILNSKISIDVFKENFEYMNDYISGKVLSSNLNIQLEFLRGFFDVNTLFNNNRIEKEIFNKRLFFEILLLLKNLGIIAEIIDNTLVIRGKEIANFYNLVSFYNWEYDSLVTSFSISEEDFYVIPNIQNIVKAYYDSIEEKNKKIELNEDFQFNRDNILKILEMKGNKELKDLIKALVNENICYDTIISIEEIDKDFCFDFGFVNDNKTYLINSFITYNN